MSHGGNVIQELTADHREVEDLFARIDKLPPRDPGRKQLVDELTIELVRHSVAEEQYLYPAVREHVSGGDALADKEIADHARVEQLLKDLEGCEADDDHFDGLVSRLQAEVSEHVADEEQHLFVELTTSCSPDALHKLGEKVRTAKKTAPTRPHPSSPSTPPANKLLAPGVGLVDRVRDHIGGRGK
ncbi:hemerythrin domain-containing protein [Streptomyces indicus]|uniref:Hemerythrin HHE cation binding domain-containing protein n=1 Tax=Streptomyces indicus TaxID=417292 RepID=A0A1G8ZPM5_9ACTN|nr:hemerythrin domain-containing protein [Streptomyces indicus]SDK16315.1 Hemerythrin HHE cation binding domain-containing protein [Streptomyces indicus]